MIDQPCDDDRSSCSSAPRLPSWEPRSLWRTHRARAPRSRRSGSRPTRRSGRPSRSTRPAALRTSSRPSSAPTGGAADWQPAERVVDRLDRRGDRGDDLGEPVDAARTAAPDLDASAHRTSRGGRATRCTPSSSDVTRTTPCQPLRCRCGALPLRLEQRRRDAGARRFELVSNGSAQSGITDPSIAYDATTGPHLRRLHQRPIRAAQPAGPGSTSQVASRRRCSDDDGVGGMPALDPPGGAALMQVRPSIAVLPNGRVGIAYYDATTEPGDVLVTTCTPPTGYTAEARVWQSGHDRRSALDPDVSSGRSRCRSASAGRRRPQRTSRRDVVEGDRRERHGRLLRDIARRGSDVRPAAARGRRRRGRSSNQIDPSIAIDPATDERTSRSSTRATTPPGTASPTSASKPPGLGYRRVLVASVPVETHADRPDSALPAGPAEHRLTGSASPRSLGRSDRPWTLIAWTDTRSATGGTPRNEDVYSTVLLHGTTAPVGINSDGGPVQRNVATSGRHRRNGCRCRPADLRDRAAGRERSGSDPRSEQAAGSPTPARPLGPDQVKVLISDGIFQTTATVTLQVVNTPPEITCSTLSTPVNTALSLAGCVKDANFDPVTLDASAPAARQGPADQRRPDLRARSRVRRARPR